MADTPANVNEAKFHVFGEKQIPESVLNLLLLDGQEPPCEVGTNHPSTHGGQAEAVSTSRAQSDRHVLESQQTRLKCGDRWGTWWGSQRELHWECCSISRVPEVSRLYQGRAASKVDHSKDSCFQMGYNVKHSTRKEVLLTFDFRSIVKSSGQGKALSPGMFTIPGVSLHLWYMFSLLVPFQPSQAQHVLDVSIN